MITEKIFGTTSDGREVKIFELKNSSGTTAKIISYGGRLTSWKFNGIDVVLGFEKISDYEKDSAYLGAIVGRCANRIANAEFELNGKIYKLDKNDGGKNHLHGGFNGFEKKIWATEILSDGLKLSVKSPDGEGGYPGNFQAEVIYKLTEKNNLEIFYEATSDADTLCNLTNHTYFNLDGGGKILEQKIQIFAEKFTWANEESIPDGKILSVEGTPLNLKNLQKIGEHIDDDYDEIKFGHGYDHNYCVGKLGEMKKVARAEGKINLEVFTTQPGLQFYSGNFLPNSRTGFALETQFYPNAINVKNFDKPILKKGEKFSSKTIYKLF